MRPVLDAARVDESTFSLSPIPVVVGFKRVCRRDTAFSYAGGAHSGANLVGHSHSSGDSHNQPADDAHGTTHGDGGDGGPLLNAIRKRLGIPDP